MGREQVAKLDALLQGGAPPRRKKKPKSGKKKNKPVQSDSAAGVGLPPLRSTQLSPVQQKLVDTIAETLNQQGVTADEVNQAAQDVREMGTESKRLGSAFRTLMNVQHGVAIPASLDIPQSLSALQLALLKLESPTGPTEGSFTPQTDVRPQQFQRARSSLQATNLESQLDAAADTSAAQTEVGTPADTSTAQTEVGTPAALLGSVLSNVASGVSNVASGVSNLFSPSRPTQTAIVPQSPVPAIPAPAPTPAPAPAPAPTPAPSYFKSPQFAVQGKLYGIELREISK